MNLKLSFLCDRWDVPKKRIPRAEFHRLLLDFVECVKLKVRIPA